MSCSMEHQNDTTSNASGSRDQESTGFSDDPGTELWSQAHEYHNSLPPEHHHYGTDFQVLALQNQFLQCPGETSSRVMASKLLEIHQSGGNSRESPPVWKKMRSVGKEEVHVEKVKKSSVRMGTRELNTMEHLLVQCATSLEANDLTHAQQTMFVINSIASPDGDPNQRLLSHFLRALLSRYQRRAHLAQHAAVKTILELTTYIDVMPWYRFGFIAANGAILAAMEGKQNVHILDFNTSHCTQWPTFIEALSERADPAPSVRLTICVSTAPIPPLLDVPYQDLITRLQKFATSKNVMLQCELVDHISKVRLSHEESLAVNCLYRLHYVTEEGGARDETLRFIRELRPEVVTLAEEDVSLTSPDLITRLRSAFNHLWIPLDALHTLLAEGSCQRRRLEDEVAEKIANVVACEGRERVERAETRQRWVERMRRAGFAPVGFAADVVDETKDMLAEHSGCWGVRKEDYDQEEALLLTWKGHDVSFASAWTPVVDHQGEIVTCSR